MVGRETEKARRALITSADEVRHFAGPVSDHTVAAVLNIYPTAEDMEIAVLFARGQGDRVARLGHELEGKAAQIYDLLLEDELYLPAERREQ